MKIFLCILISCALLSVAGTQDAFGGAVVVKDSGRTYIVDQTGERWDVTQAESLGFEADKFQYGIGRYAFKPLDDTGLSDDSSFVSLNERVIGVADGENAQAYSVSKLSRHEVANSMFGEVPIAVGY